MACSPEARSLELKALEAVQFLLDAALEVLARGVADPAPCLHQHLAARAGGLEADRGDDVLPHKHRQREIAEHPLLFGDISLEAMRVAEKQFGAPALDDQRIERGEDVDQIGRLSRRLDRVRPDPMLLLAGAFDGGRHQFAAADPCLDQPPNSRLGRRVEMADRIEAHQTLSAERAVEQIGRYFVAARRLRRLVPAEVALRQLIRLEHTVALADGYQ